MPFTVSHVAAVAPLARWGLPVPALVIGSVAPDIFTMLPIPSLVHFAHLPLGLVTADLAVGVAAFVLWQAFYGPAVIAIAPSALRARLAAPISRSPISRSPRSRNLPGNPPLEGPHRRGLPGKLRDPGRVLAAVLLGAATHLVWDSFTHDWMWGTQHIPWLAKWHGDRLGFQWVQVISDLVGLAVVAAWIADWWRKASVRPDTTVMPLRRRVFAWLAILGPSGVVFCVLLSRDSFYVAITVAAGLGVVGLTIVALLVRRDPGRRVPGSP